ncbi:hypothetical protein [Actinoplanes sichuanensis]|uniref:DUF5666 domain-containing protein n=1 Tax=Actinoplanes sichuanensis TaxID=512349 RepID=A0ABW4AJM8_9ACTN|nr:hypothetical protein [Actinoplanes sichuanensis]
MARTSVQVLIFAVALAVTGCGAQAPAHVADAAIEMAALQEVGFDAGDAGDVGPAASDSPGVRPRAVRRLLRQNTLHGEVVVRTREGEDRTIVVQRGEVTTADDKGFTVKSSDGYVLTWTFGDPLRVAQNREKTERSAVKAGVQVGVGGVRDGSAVTARLIIVK